jgi:hypothetical protein
MMRCYDPAPQARRLISHAIKREGVFELSALIYQAEKWTWMGLSDKGQEL